MKNGLDNTQNLYCVNYIKKKVSLNQPQATLTPCRKMAGIKDSTIIPISILPNGLVPLIEVKLLFFLQLKALSHCIIGIAVKVRFMCYSPQK